MSIQRLAGMENVAKLFPHIVFNNYDVKLGKTKVSAGSASRIFQEAEAFHSLVMWTVPGSYIDTL